MPIPHFASAHRLRRVAGVLYRRTGTCRGQAAGPGGGSVGDCPARLFLRRRPVCRRARQDDHARPDLCGGAGAEARAPLSAGADPRRGADRDQLDGHAGRAQGLGGVFRRAGLHRLHDRPADARALGGAPLRRADPHVHGRERGMAVHRGRARAALAAGQAAHAMAGRRPQQGPQGRSGVRRVLRHPGRDRDLQRGDAGAQPGRPARRCSTASGRRSC